MTSSTENAVGAPLRRDDPAIQVQPPFFVERVLMFIPIFGWIVAQMLWGYRASKVDGRAREIVKARPAGVIERGWPTERQKEIASLLAAQIQQNFAWPAAQLLPDDFVGILCLDDDGETWDIAEELATALKVPERVLKARIEDLFHKATLREMVLEIDEVVARFHPVTVIHS